MIITVTQEHIDKAREMIPKYDRSYCCPVALAAGDGARVGSTKMEIKCKIYKLPEDVMSKIVKFDTYDKMEPFSFQPLEISNHWRCNVSH